MAMGPGKYDELCSYVFEKAQPMGGVVVMVLGGNQGNGFAVQATPATTRQLPRLLRDMADDIEKDLAKLPPK